MIKFLKKELLIILSSLLLSILGTWALSFFMPALTAEQSKIIGAVLFVIIWLLIKFGSLLLKTAVIVLVAAAVFYYLKA